MLDEGIKMHRHPEPKDEKYWHRTSEGDFPLLEDIGEAEEINDNVTGVYIIWGKKKGYKNTQIKVIYVGQGNIKTRLLDHIVKDDFLNKYQEVLCSWVKITKANVINGVEHYLFDLFMPIEGERTPRDDYYGINPPKILMNLIERE